MTQDRKTEPEPSAGASSAGGQSGARHWQHREASPLDPVQYKQWCDDRIVQMMAEPMVQRAREGGEASAEVHAAAQQGLAEPGGPLPHLAQIQQSFGPQHDVSHVQAHVGGAAATASAQMGAQAYATGDHVAFASQPDVHLAAHEAAHTVQQRAGVQLAGGVGVAGDVYERNADQVADRVVAGQPAADLLAGGGGAPAGVQHKKAHDEDPAKARPHDDEAEEDDDEELDADEGDEQSAAPSALSEGKPPGAVQKKAASPGGPQAHAARRRKKLTIAEATQRYAPLVYIAKGENNNPSDPNAFIDNSSLRWSHDSGRGDHEIAGMGDVDANRLGSGGYSHQTEGLIGGHGGDPIHSDDNARPKDGKGDGGDEGFFLDHDNSKHDSTGTGTNMPVFYEAVAGHYITYWFFYKYNTGPAPGGADNHEGDWERICVKLNKRNRATHVAYYQHNGHEVKEWKAVPKQGSHPIVFSAKGSHASYSTAGQQNVDVPYLPDAFDDHTSKGNQWKTWQRLRNAKTQDWYGYGGAWGEVGNWEHSTGPQGPSRHKSAAPKGW